MKAHPVASLDAAVFSAREGVGALEARNLAR